MPATDLKLTHRQAETLRLLQNGAILREKRAGTSYAIIKDFRTIGIVRESTFDKFFDNELLAYDGKKMGYTMSSKGLTILFDYDF